MLITALGVGGLIAACLMFTGFIDAIFARWDNRLTREESEFNRDS